MLTPFLVGDKKADVMRRPWGVSGYRQYCYQPTMPVIVR